MEQKSRFDYRKNCVAAVMSYSSYDLRNIEERLIKGCIPNKNKEIFVEILDASECFMAAKKIMDEFPGPAILLFLSAINIFAKGIDIKLKETIDEAKELLKREGFYKECVKETISAAYDKASFMGVNKFIREELGAGLLDAGYNKESAENVAKEVLSASHKVRHEAQIDGAYISLIAGAGQGGSKVLEKKEMDTLRKVGKVKVSDMPITGIFPIVVKSFKKLVKPAEQGSANAITKRVCFVFECECEAEHK